MAKGLFKENNKLVWGGAILVAAIFLFYIFKRREGFQNTPGVQTGMPTVIPAVQNEMSTPPSNPVEADISELRNTAKLTPPVAAPMGAKPSIALVRSKLNELKTMVDNM